MEIVNKEKPLQCLFMYKNHNEECPGHLLHYEQAAISKAQAFFSPGRKIIY